MDPTETEEGSYQHYGLSKENSDNETPSSKDDISHLENVFVLIPSETPICNKYEAKIDEFSPQQQIHVSSVPTHDRNRLSKSSQSHNQSTVCDRDDGDRRLCTPAVHTSRHRHERSGLDRYVQSKDSKRPVSLDWITSHRDVSDGRYGDVPGTKLCIVEVGVARLLPFLQTDKAHVVVTRCIKKGATNTALQYPNTCVTNLTGNTEAEN